MGVYGHEKREWLNLIRDIRLYNDIGKWHFEQAGEPFPLSKREGTCRKIKQIGLIFYY